MNWVRHLWPFYGINVKLDDLKRRLIQVSVNEEQFGADLKILTDAIVELIAAVDKLLESRPDLTDEDQAVKDAAASVRAELDKINPPA